ncbi:hypothetical protein RRF57_003614 [Xylaria bambusicola]|uniref:WSC domain-containing protein n=1 Tax=Xylaria bambusicola TaxID=326684 RepID=A0AAN7UL18_9PEZI
MDPTFPSPEDQTDISEYAPVGCWTDDSSQGRALFYRQDNLASSEMTNEKCLKSCLDGGFPFAGTEYGGECYCGVVIGNGTALATDESTCNMPCNGDSSQTCGGPARLSLYVAKDLQSLEPCGSPSNTSSTTTGYPTTTTTKGYPTSPTKTTTKSTTKATTSSPSTTKTTTKVTTTTTAPVCTATTVIPSDCEWKIGKWCSDPVPDWDDKKDCLISGSKCLLQGTSCFLKAGLPGALSCFKYKEWCVALDLYCVTKCIGKYCDKAGFIEKSPPYGLPPTTSTSTYPCPTTVTTTTKTTTTPPPYPTDDCPPPNPTGICIQPTNKWFGYGPGKPVGGIELPVVTCNNIWGDWKNGNIFKLYTDKDSKKCPSYPVYQFPNACADACKSQYEQCEDVYAESCKMGYKTYSYKDAEAACEAQYKDCLTVNKWVKDNGHCTTWDC